MYKEFIAPSAAIIGKPMSKNDLSGKSPFKANIEWYRPISICS
ncbi:MAG: hypothetical protein QMO91_03300 [Candidatus Tisiphia sp.]|nr:hypothetical protein [Candidatus Tisiphia sp.]